MKKVLFVLMALFLVLQLNAKPNDNEIKNAVWETILGHNKAWTQLEDLNELEKYIDEHIFSFSPPFKTYLKGKKAYLDGYKNWFEHAKVHFAKEHDPDIQLYLNGTMAIVTFEIELQFEYDGVLTSDWKGRDVMSLKFEDGRWLITSDQFVRYEK